LVFSVALLQLMNSSLKHSILYLYSSSLIVFKELDKVLLEDLVSKVKHHM